MSKNGNATVAEAVAEAEQEALKAQHDSIRPAPPRSLSHQTPTEPEAPPAIVQWSPEWFAVQIMAAEAAANQQMAAFMATEAFQLWQQRVGELNALRKLAALATSQPTP